MKLNAKTIAALLAAALGATLTFSAPAAANPAQALVSHAVAQTDDAYVVEAKFKRKHRSHRAHRSNRSHRAHRSNRSFRHHNHRSRRHFGFGYGHRYHGYSPRYSTHRYGAGPFLHTRRY